MTKTFFVELCTLNGPTLRRRWLRIFRSASRAECVDFIEGCVADLPSRPIAERGCGLTRERALRDFYRVRSERLAA